MKSLLTSLGFVLFLLLLSGGGGRVLAAPPPCEEGWKSWVFTPCTNGHRSSIEYFTKECVEVNVKARAPITVPCIKYCGSGTFWDPRHPTASSCTKCQPGSMSNSGGKLYNDFSNGEWPEGFVSYCDPQPCQGWQIGASGSYLWSGNQSAGGIRYNKWYPEYEDESVTSTLVMMVPVINDKHDPPGSVFFKYRTESEFSFDGLRIKVNGTVVKDPMHPDAKSDYFQTGWHPSWTNYELKLPFGLSEVRFEYVKDQNQNSMFGDGVGGDAAYLRDFIIEGLQWYASECTPCAAGKHAQREGAMKCVTCPRNTYSNAKEGLASCKPCTAATQWAPPGSSKCRTRLPCVKHDYIAQYTPCDLKSMTRTQSWDLTNSRCDTSSASSFKPINKPGVPCANCLRGFHRDVNSHTCVSCVDGQYYNEKQTKCQKCPAGTAGIREVYFKEGFNLINQDGAVDPKYFKMKCVGNCAGCQGDGNCTVDNAGFQLIDLHTDLDMGGADHTLTCIRSDLDNGDEFEVTLTYNWISHNPGHVHFYYHFMRMSMLGSVAADNEGYAATVTVDGETQPLNKNFVNLDHSGYWYKEVEGTGFHSLTISFSQSSSHEDNDPIAFVISEFHVEGDATGGVQECTPCRRGYYCPEGTNKMIPCAAGSFNKDESMSSAGSCKPCPAGSISAKPGSAKCTPCPDGTIPNEKNTKCINSCKFSHEVKLLQSSLGRLEFDFSALRGHTYGPVIFGDAGAAGTSAGAEGTVTTGSDAAMSQAQADALNVHRFFLSPCTPAARGCTPRTDPDTGFPEDEYACQRVNANQTYHAGSEVSYQYQGGQLVATYTGGTKCHHGGMERSTNLTFECDPAAEGLGVMTYTGENPHCHYNFVLKSKYGCILCTELDYTKTVGECLADNQRRVVYKKAYSASRCAGGYVPPSDEKVQCVYCQKSFYEETWSHCTFGKQQRIMVLKDKYKDCVGDNKVQFTNVSRACRQVELRVGKNGFTLFFAVLIPVFLIIVTIAVCYICKHNSLKNKYARLEGAGNGGGPGAGEMSDISDFNTEDENKARAASAAKYEDNSSAATQNHDDLERENRPSINEDV